MSDNAISEAGAGTEKAVTPAPYPSYFLKKNIVNINIRCYNKVYSREKAEKQQDIP